MTEDGYLKKLMEDTPDIVMRIRNPPVTPSEHVEHPSHYGGEDDPYEVIKVLKAWMTQEELIGFCKGNAIKYIARAGRKADQPVERDLAKAKWYLAYIESL